MKRVAARMMSKIASLAIDAAGGAGWPAPTKGSTASAPSMRRRVLIGAMVPPVAWPRNRADKARS
jgi:hypothetical protein